MQGPELMNKYVGESERAVREVRGCAWSGPRRTSAVLRGVLLAVTGFEICKSKFQWRMFFFWQILVYYLLFIFALQLYWTSLVPWNDFCCWFQAYELTFLSVTVQSSLLGLSPPTFYLAPNHFLCLNKFPVHPWAFTSSWEPYEYPYMH